MLDQGRSLEEETGVPSGILAWKIPWTEGPGGYSRPRGPEEEEELSAHRSSQARVHGRLRLAWGPRQPRESASQVALDTEVPRGLAPQPGPSASLPAEPEVRSRAVTKVRESPLGLSGQARPVSSTGPADPGFLTCDPPPSRDSIPGDAGLLAPPGTRGQKGPGAREETAVSHQDSVCSPSPSAASSLPRGFGRTEPDTSRSPARDRLPGRPPASSPAPEPRAPRSALALLPTAGAFDVARRGAPRRPATAWSSDPQTSLGDAPLSGKEEAPSRKDVRTGNRLRWWSLT
ncbi:collagen alpha-1(I) chain-like [Odocoileus virginianus]|uniref:Collagen alpha-1(I) chain-like n=1 Tax=Odocoileus virginianus TaxID=9874 RepID=A0ABM4HUT4_ODOVR